MLPTAVSESAQGQTHNTVNGVAPLGETFNSLLWGWQAWLRWSNWRLKKKVKFKDKGKKRIKTDINGGSMFLGRLKYLQTNMNKPIMMNIINIIGY